MKKIIHAADLFCGAGGTSAGLVQACHELGHNVALTAINHWDVAITTHTQNHPEARHYCQTLDALNPRELFKENELDVLWASPECTHHSVARGGKPINDQSRSTAWCVTRWAEALRPRVILVENVKEFRSWGPIGSNNRPLASKKGIVFQQWLRTLESLGYRVDYRVLCAADYGDPTTRERLFVMAVRGRLKIVWPEPTHAKRQQADLFANRLPWRPARDIIDFSIQGQSIFNRKKDLRSKTMRRIFIGLFKHAFPDGTKPYLIKFNNNQDALTLDDPAPTITTSGAHLGLATPYLINTAHGNDAKSGDESRARSIEDPMATITGGRNGEWALAQPYVIPQQSGGTPRSTEDPMATVSTAGALALVEPYIIPKQGYDDRTRSVDEPLQTVCTQDRGIGLVEPYVIPIDNGSTKDGSRPVDDPLSTVVTEQRHGLTQPYFIKYNKTGEAHSVGVPLDTVTARDRFGLCTTQVIADSVQAEPAEPLELDGELYMMVRYKGQRCLPIVWNGRLLLLDILFRMVQPKELALAQGFLPDYQFSGTREQVVKQIGNAVPRRLARALAYAALTQNSTIPATEEPTVIAA